jgi:hypothetical protein
MCSLESIRVIFMIRFTGRVARLACSSTLAVAAISPSAALACACGCSIFDVGANSTFPGQSDSGLTLWARYAFMDQNSNWEGTSHASNADNSDKEIRTNFYFLGGQFMVNHDWGVMVEMPFFSRSLKTTDDGTVQGPAGSVYTGHDDAIGDLVVQGMYTGFAPDMSTGVTFGVKLPSGDYTGPKGSLGGPEFDRDTLPGTGSTDLVLGAYHLGAIDELGQWSYFVQGRYQFAVATRDGYRPGNMFDAAAGVSYDLGRVGPLNKVAPVLQILSSNRQRDSGINADSPNSGYKRILLAPGVNVRAGNVRIYADVEVPIYQRTNAASSVAIEGTSGQLVAARLFKVQLSYDF